MVAFLGMRGSGSFVADQRPKSWREMILRLYPNGSAPLTAIMSKMKSESVTDPEFSWWTKSLPTQRATITGIYTDELSTAYVTGAAAAASLWVKMSANDAKQFVPGKQVMFRLSTDYRLDTIAKVTAVTVNGASSFVKVSLLEADDNGVGKDLSDADTLLIIGSIHEEGATRPQAIAYDPVKVNNYTQIFRNSLSMTRTAMKTRLRTDDAKKEAKREALELHSIEMEKAFLWGIATEGTGDNGYPERTTMGVIPFVKTYAAANCSDFSLDASYSGKAWTDGSGEEWLDKMLEQILRYGSKDKLALCGSAAILGINKIAKDKGTWQFSSTTKSYGINVTEWVTPFGSINLISHPLFSYEPTNRNSMLICEPADWKFRYIDDTTFKADDRLNKGGGTGKDGIDEEFLTEGGLEFALPEKCGYLNGIGKDSAV